MTKIFYAIILANFIASASACTYRSKDVPVSVNATISVSEEYAEKLYKIAEAARNTYKIEMQKFKQIVPCLISKHRPRKISAPLQALYDKIHKIEKTLFKSSGTSLQDFNYSDNHPLRKIDYTVIGPKQPTIICYEGMGKCRYRKTAQSFFRVNKHIVGLETKLFESTQKLHESNQKLSKDVENLQKSLDLCNAKISEIANTINNSPYKKPQNTIAYSKSQNKSKKSNTEKDAPEAADFIQTICP